MRWHKIMFAGASPTAALKKAVRLATALEAKLEVVYSRSWEAVVREVVIREPDLLIVQSTGRGRGARRLLSGTDYRLIETCPCPLLLVKNAQPYASTCTLAAVDPRLAHGKPVALDDAILLAAQVMSQALSNEIRVYHALTPWLEASRRVPGLQHLPQVEQADARAAYHERTAGLVRDLARRYGIPDSRVRVVEGPTADLLPAFARTESADVVVLGTAERSFLKRILIGHTAERLLDTLDCDILVVKPPGFRAPIRRWPTRLPGNRTSGERSGAPHGRYLFTL